MKQEELKFSIRQVYLEFINIILLNNSLLNYLDKIDLFGIHKLFYFQQIKLSKLMFASINLISGSNIKEILNMNTIKNYVLSDDSNILTYLYMIIKEINHIYVSTYLDLIIESIKPICEKIKTNDLYTGEKYVRVMLDYKNTIQQCTDDELNYDSFISLTTLCLCDVIILWYNYTYSLYFDDRSRIKNVNIFVTKIEKSTQELIELKELIDSKELNELNELFNNIHIF